jgi:glycosyltransferase involved in cell wall biosynthesis
LGRTLDALEAQALDQPFEVLLVDDGSRDDTVAIAEARAPFVTVIRSEESRGPGAARNLGASHARAPVLAFTDSDCFPTPGWLAAGLEAIAEADLVQGAVEPDPTVARRPFDRTVQVDSERGFYETANLLVRRDAFDAVGGFRDWLLDGAASRNGTPDRRRSRAARTPIGEDTLFAWTARRLGARTAFAADAVVHHAVVPGRLADDLADRRHWARDMPGLARLVPELRDGCFYRRWFFHRKTARFDLAALSLALAAVLRRPVALAGAAPYLLWVLEEAARFEGRDAVRFALGSVVTDAVTAGSLAAGSAHWRCPVL